MFSHSVLAGPYNPDRACSTGLGSSHFARHYFGNSFFSSGYLDVSVPQVPLSYPMCSDRRSHRFAVRGFPIRIFPDQRLYTASRDFSQCPTSFIGIWRLGIHHKLLLASSLIRRTRLSSTLFSFFLFLAPSCTTSLWCFPLFDW